MVHHLQAHSNVESLPVLGRQQSYPLVNSQFANKGGPFMVDLPLKNGAFP